VGTTDIALTGASSNVATITIKSTDVAPLAGVYVHELALTDSNSKKRTLTQGEVTIHRELIV